MFYTGNNRINLSGYENRQNYNARSLDTITKEWTAFKSFDDLMQSVRERGYVPTIRDEPPSGWLYTNWDSHPFRWDKERLRNAVREAGGKVYPELDRPWDQELHRHGRVGYTFTMSNLKMYDLHKEIRKRKRELSRIIRHEGKHYYPNSCEVLACDERGDRLDNAGKCYCPLYTDAYPTKRELLKHIDEYKSDTHFLYLCNQPYWIDPKDPMDVRYDYAEPTGEYWGLHIRVR